MRKYGSDRGVNRRMDTICMYTEDSRIFLFKDAVFWSACSCKVKLRIGPYAMEVMRRSVSADGNVSELCVNGKSYGQYLCIY